MHLILYAHWTIRCISIDWLIDWLISNWFRAFTVPMYVGLKNGPFVPHNLIPVQGSPVPSLKFQMAPRGKLLMSFGSDKKELRYTRLSEAKASHSQRMWANVSYSPPHLLRKVLMVSPIKWRCLSQGFMSSKMANNNPILCPTEGKKYGLCSRTSARNKFYNLSLTMCFLW